jgi:hypothetical protein
VLALWPLIYELVEAEISRRRDTDAFAYSDDMSGQEFEQFCAEQLRRTGWQGLLTKATGDQGADIVAERDRMRVVLQCKRSFKPVGNKAVQEAVAARMHEAADVACVMSNAGLLDGDGSRETIAVNGPLVLFARCELSLGIGQDQVSIRAFSDIAGAGLAASSGFVPSPPPNEFLLSFGRTVNGPGTEIYTRAVEAAGSNVEGTSVLAPDGSYIGVEASTLGLGLNILDHDCIAVGTAHLDNAPLE